jgi:hypothetical protein
MKLWGKRKEEISHAAIAAHSFAARKMPTNTRVCGESEKLLITNYLIQA